jgi:hypothetical protein
MYLYEAYIGVIYGGGSIMKMSIRHFSLLVATGVVLVSVLFATSLWGSEPNKLSGITVKDEHPQGCVDCHVKVSDDKDYRLPAELAKVEKHPPIEKIVKVVPVDCLKCHKEGSKGGPLNLITHKKHYQNPSENHFISNYNGDCLNCHILDMSTFKMGVKSGPANW